MIVPLAFALSFAASQPANTSAVQQELTEFEARLAAAWKSGDCDGWGAMLAPDWSVIHITGAVMSKDEALQMCRHPPLPLESMESEVLSVRVFGDAAVVTGRTTVTVGGAERQTVTLRFSDFFVRRDGRWQVVASHATRLAP